MLKNRSMPDSGVIPVLAYPDVNAAVDWLCRAFGFTVRLRIGNHRVQLNAGTGAVVVAQGPGRSAVMVRVADVDAHYQRTLAAGIPVAGVPATYPFGERQYSAEDLGHHVWTFSESVADVDPAEWGDVST